MPETERPLRADARRNRERIVAAAAELFARHGRDAQIEDIAAHSGVGMGTVYRHFPNKQALLTEMVRRRFEGLAGLARTAERITDPGDAFETVLRRYLEAADGDAAFQLALMGGHDLQWKDVKAQKSEFTEAVSRIIDRAVAAGRLRADLTVSDFPLIASGLISTMYFKPAGNADWRRHLELILYGIRDPHRMNDSGDERDGDAHALAATGCPVRLARYDEPSYVNGGSPPGPRVSALTAQRR